MNLESIPRLPKGLLAFALVGGLGFAVDGGLLTLLSQVAGVNLYLSRLCSFMTATATTWLLNSIWTFKTADSSAGQKRREYSRYLVVQVCGALVNLGVFTALVIGCPNLRHIPVIPLLIGAVFGLMINYSGSRYWVFPVGAG